MTDSILNELNAALVSLNKVDRVFASGKWDESKHPRDHGKFAKIGRVHSQADIRKAGWTERHSNQNTRVWDHPSKHSMTTVGMKGGANDSHHMIHTPPSKTPDHPDFNKGKRKGWGLNVPPKKQWWEKGGKWSNNLNPKSKINNLPKSKTKSKSSGSGGSGKSKKAAESLREQEIAEEQHAEKARPQLSTPSTEAHAASKALGWKHEPKPGANLAFHKKMATLHMKQANMGGDWDKGPENAEQHRKAAQLHAKAAHHLNQR